MGATAVIQPTEDGWRRCSHASESLPWIGLRLRASHAATPHGEKKHAAHAVDLFSIFVVVSRGKLTTNGNVDVGRPDETIRKLPAVPSTMRTP
jgi:hypothetical protein